MDVHLSGRGVAIPQALRRRIETKVAKVTRFLPKIADARVVLSRERHRHVAEVTLLAQGAPLHAEADGAGFYAAVDLAVSHLQEQVRRRKERIRARKPRPSRRIARRAAVPGTSPPADEESPVVVRRLTAKPMSIDEALEQMRVREVPLLVFTNARTRNLNVLHRRADGQLELVQPGG
jgi:ribosome hibernation promoting factor